MISDYWLKQGADKPLFPDILWARPENKQSAGKLLIIGGNLHSFASIGEAYSTAVETGAGTIRVLLPDALRKIVGKAIQNCEYAPSNPSGSFAKASLNEMLVEASWADCVLLAGDFGHNSETAIALEAFVQKYSGPLVLTKDAIDYFTPSPKLILNRLNTCIIGATAQLQKLATGASYTQAITTSMDLVRLVEVLRDFACKHASIFITHQLGTTLVIAEGKVSTTKTGSSEDIWRIPVATKASVFWMHSPTKPFEALTTSVFL